MSNRNERSWSRGQRKVPDYPQTPERAAAQFVRVTAHRYLNDNATAMELDEAIRCWTELRTERGAA